MLRLDAMATIEVREDGLPGPVHVAALSRRQQRATAASSASRPTLPSQLELDFRAGSARSRTSSPARAPSARSDAVERAILVVVTAGRDRGESDSSTDELRELARTAGVEVVDVLVQNRPQADPKTAIGSGKLEELMIRCLQSDVDLVIFDDDSRRCRRGTSASASTCA